MSEAESTDAVAATTSKAKSKTTKAPKGKKKKATPAAASAVQPGEEEDDSQQRNLEQEITDGVHGLSVQFVYAYSRHLCRLKAIAAEFDALEVQFKQLGVNALAMAASKRSSQVDKAPEEPEEPAAAETVVRKQDVLIKKFQTPLETRTKASIFATGQKTVIVVPSALPKQLLPAVPPGVEEAPAAAANKKKRKTAEQSLLVQETTVMAEPESEEAKKRKKIKTKKKKAGAKKAATAAAGDTLTDEPVDDAVEIVTKSVKSESNSSMVKLATGGTVKTTTKTCVKTEVTVETSAATATAGVSESASKNQPAKKIRISQDESHLEPLREGDDEEGGGGGASGRASTVSAKSSTSKKKGGAKKKTGTKSAAKPSSAEPAVTPSKTAAAVAAPPDTVLYSSNSKTTTVKQVTTTQTRPMTRRGAATGSTKAATTATNTTTNTTTPGKVKQMVDMVEARLKTSDMLVPSTPFSTMKKNPTSHVLSALKTATKVAPAAATAVLPGQKIRSSIDSRKIRTSNAKADAKRQSVKRVNAFLSNLAENAENAVAMTTVTPVKEQQQQQLSNETIDMTKTPSVLVDLKPVQTAKKKLFEHDKVDPSTQVKAVPTVSVIDHTGSLLATIKRPMNVRELINANSMTVGQQYRIAPSVKNTPSLHRAGERKQSFAKFIERNTPSKMTRTELEEKRKAELAAKQAKEAERIQELNSLKNEKIETNKKKREEKMKKINELKVRQLEEEAKRREEIDAKLASAEENKKKMLEEKRKEEYEKQKQREARLQAAATAGNADLHTIQVPTTTVLASAQKKAGGYYSQINKPAASATSVLPSSSFYSNATINLGTSSTAASTCVKPETTTSATANYDNLSTFKSNFLLQSQQVKQLMTPLSLKPSGGHVVSSYPKPMITDSAIKSQNFHTFLKPQDSNQQVNKSYTISNNSSSGSVVDHGKPVKTVSPDNYDVSGLRSDDDTDDEEEPSKPIPAWAKQPLLNQAARAQSFKFINYTKLFKAACTNEIILDDIFKFKRKKFNERSSSANWSSPPVWRTNGISGEESFRQFQRL